MSIREAICRWLLPCAACVALLSGSPCRAGAVQAMSTEAFLNHLGVDTHLDGLTAADPWNSNPVQVASQLRYLGVRLDRDWAWSLADGSVWHAVRLAWPLGRFWSSIGEGSPADQRSSLGAEETIAKTYPRLIYVMGGPNEEDDSYAQSLGATLPNSAQVQQTLYTWASRRDILVSQMEFGAGWTAANGWQGDYNPADTGIGQNYVPGQADIAAAHTYISNPYQRPVDVLNQLRTLANLTTPGRPVAHTEMGAYTAANLSTAVYGQYMVMGAFDSAAAGDAAYIVYGLQDSGPEQTYGFFTYPAGTPNPAAVDYHIMTSLLHSAVGSYGPGGAATFTPGSLGVTYTNPSTSHLLLQRPDGRFVIADWSEQLMNGSQQSVTDTVAFGKQFAVVRVYDIESGATPISTARNAGKITLVMNPSDTYLIALSAD